METYLPKKDFRIEIIGIICLLIVPLTLAVISSFFVAKIEVALPVNLFVIGIVGAIYWLFQEFIPYGVYNISDRILKQKKLGFVKSISFDEVTEINRVEMTSPFTYWGQYYFYVKSRDSKIKFSDRIENHEELLKSILEKCGETSFNYSEDPMNKWWKR